MKDQQIRAGMVSILGRPNVGKSSLLNALIGRKRSIVSHKPQTTRHAIQAVLHGEASQIVFVDTPGLHINQKRGLNRAMNETAAASLHGIDAVLFVVEAGRWTEEDQQVLERINGIEVPVGLVLNKIDQVPDKSVLLPELDALSKRREFSFMLPVSATRKSGLSNLVAELESRMPSGPPLYPPDMDAGFDNGFLAAELIREKLTRNLHQELPYSLTVAIEKYEKEGKLHRIDAVVWVERDGQKKIVIGKSGSTLKRVGSDARRELEQILGDKVFLQLWCRVRDNWSDDPKALKQFGLTGE